MKDHGEALQKIAGQTKSKLTSLDDIMPNTKYLGNSTGVNWVSEGTPQAYDDGVLLTMPPNSVGTLLSSTHYVWYGKIDTTMKTSRGQGVVTAFIMMSDVKDERCCSADLEMWLGSVSLEGGMYQGFITTIRLNGSFVRVG